MGFTRFLALNIPDDDESVSYFLRTGEDIMIHLKESAEALLIFTHQTNKKLTENNCAGEGCKI